MSEDDREAARAMLLALYSVDSVEDAEVLLLELLHDPEARSLVLRAYPELGDTH